jgi:transcriptional regulator with XRE-family HTH domain
MNYRMEQTAMYGLAMPSTLGERLRELRRERGNPNRDKVAHAVGVTAQMVGKWERGEAIPRPENRLALAKLYNVDPNDLDYEVPTELTPSMPPWFTEFAEQTTAALEELREQNIALMEALKKLR